LANGDIIFPKSNTADRVRENFEIFDFELDEGSMAAITDLDRGEKGRTGGNPDTMAWMPKR
jgi:2,5-diketo-D-gluconate reductase A